MTIRPEPPKWINLDRIDWMILHELQTDGRMTNVELAKRVGISAPPCLRRVRALETAGFHPWVSCAAERQVAWLRSGSLRHGAA
jgi:hypothetical protein